MDDKRRVNFAKFKGWVRDAATDPAAEKRLRVMVEECAKDCPIDILVQLGQCIIDIRRSEIRGEIKQEAPDNLAVFTQCVQNVSVSEKANQHVRMMLERFAKNAPIYVLVQLGQVLADDREECFRQEDQQN